MIFFNASSEITNGLNIAKSLNLFEIVSIGKIVFEKNIKTDAVKTAAKIVVSSDLNKYPMNIPKKMKTLKEINKTRTISDNTGRMGILRIQFIPANINKNCIDNIIKHVK